MAPIRRGILIELSSGQNALIWCDEKKIAGKYKAYVVDADNKPTGETKLVFNRQKIIGLIS